ncbi:MAG: MaoC/PaaZ C-terminal domain-containing protein [Thermodesulfobacteriota bacterium]|nr:MaoC/PaaZ C-terminal domain-containing protein [Thermodesulfobacteriota bacterium]
MKYFEDFQVGEKSTTRSRTITEADIVNFCSFSGDWYPLHSDIEYAKKSPFGQRIAHGMLVLSVASGLLPLYDMKIVAFYGMENVRFVSPTTIGETIYMESEVTGTQDKGGMGGVITFLNKIKNHKGDDKVVYIMKGFIGKKDGG